MQAPCAGGQQTRRGVACFALNRRSMIYQGAGMAASAALLRCLGSCGHASSEHTGSPQPSNFRGRSRCAIGVSILECSQSVVFRPFDDVTCAFSRCVCSAMKPGFALAAGEPQAKGPITSSLVNEEIAQVTSACCTSDGPRWPLASTGPRTWFPNSAHRWHKKIPFRVIDRAEN